MKCLVRASTDLLTYTVILPYYLQYGKRITETFLFCAWLNYPNQKGLRKTKKVPNCEHRFLSLPNDERLGLWSIDNGGEATIVYCHGNSCNRGQKTRVSLYTKCTELGYNVVCFDYRGYGDSIGELSPEGMIQDTYTVVKWAEEHFSETKLVLWGHSLGTGVSVEFLATYPNTSVIGCVLEAPFLNSTCGAMNHPMVLTLISNDMLKQAVRVTLQDIFPTDELIHQIEVPIHIIHAVDDQILPLQHSIELIDAAKHNNKQNITMMVVQSGGHKNLANVSKATDSIKVFMKKLLRPEGYSSSSGSGSKSSSVSDTSVNHKLTYKKLIAQASIESDSSSDGKSNHSNSSSSQSEQEEASSLEDIQWVL